MKGYYKAPDNEPVVVEIETSKPSAVVDTVGGAYYRDTIKLSTGKEVELFYYQMSIQKGLEYNFSICPTSDRRTWIDICGPALVMNRCLESDLDLSADEMKELFQVPYE